MGSYSSDNAEYLFAQPNLNDNPWRGVSTGAYKTPADTAPPLKRVDTSSADNIAGAGIQAGATILAQVANVALQKYLQEEALRATKLNETTEDLLRGRARQQHQSVEAGNAMLHATDAVNTGNNAQLQASNSDGASNGLRGVVSNLVRAFGKGR